MGIYLGCFMGQSIDVEQTIFTFGFQICGLSKCWGYIMGIINGSLGRNFRVMDGGHG